MEGNMESNVTEETIIGKKRSVIQVSDQETILFLKSYQMFPCSWEKIVDYMRKNIQTLPVNATGLYQKSTYKQLKLRLSAKLGKLLKTPEEKITNLLVKDELTKVRNLEQKLVKPTDDVATFAAQKHAKSQADDIRENVMLEMSSGDERQSHNTKKNSTAEKDGRPQIRSAVKEDSGHHKRPAVGEDIEGVQLPDEQQPGPSASKKKKAEPKKTSLMQLVKKNQLIYETFMAKKVPKLLKALGVSSSSDSDE